MKFRIDFRAAAVLCLTLTFCSTASALDRPAAESELFSFPGALSQAAGKSTVTAPLPGSAPGTLTGILCPLATG